MVPNPWFGREISVRTLDVVVLAALSLVTGALIATYVVAGGSGAGAPRAGIGSGIVGWFAVGLRPRSARPWRRRGDARVCCARRPRSRDQARRLPAPLALYMPPRPTHQSAGFTIERRERFFFGIPPLDPPKTHVLGLARC